LNGPTMLRPVWVSLASVTPMTWMSGSCHALEGKRRQI
jgi:hypothetical protein